MDSKRIFKLSLAGFFTLVLLIVIFMAATTGSEASKVNTMLTDAKSKKTPLNDLKQQLVQLGYSVESSTASDLNAKGPGHWSVIYGTWLVVHAGADPAGQVNSYELTRESTWF